MRRKITDMKKVILGIGGVAAAVCILALPLSVSSEAADYKLVDHCLTVSGTEDFIDVTEDVYDKKSEITSVIIENGVTGIGENAFEGFTSLKEVTIPSSVKDIKSGAFADCTDVKITLEINGDVNISKKYYSVFSEEGIEYRISIPKNVTISDFQYVSGTLINRTGEVMQNISIEKDGIAAEFELAAGGCVSYSKEHKVLVGNVTCKEHGCFYVASQEATCGDYGSKEYYRCIACAKVFADSALKTEVTNFDDLFVPATGEHVWNEGTVEAEATAVENGKKVYTCTVCDATKQEVIYAKGAALGTVLTVGDLKFTVTKSEVNGAVAFTGVANAKTKEVVIPKKITIDGISYRVTSVAANALKGNKNVTSVTIGTNVASIGKKAFYNCKNLKKLTIKTTKLTKKNVGKYAFKGISNKATVTVPKKKYKAHTALLLAKGVSAKAKIMY